MCGDAIPRARYAGGADQVTCPNPALDEEQHHVALHALLQQLRAPGRSADTTEDIEKRMSAAELRLLRRAQPGPERVDLSRNATKRGEEDLQGEWRGTAPQPQVQAPCAGSATGTRKTTRGLFSPAGLFTGDGSQWRNDRFGVVIRGRTGPSRRRTFHLT